MTQETERKSRLKRVWKELGESFDNNIPRLTATIVKEAESTQGFAYPTCEGRLGYYFDFSTKTGYDLPPKFKFEFAAYQYPNVMGQFAPVRSFCEEQVYFPAMIRREFGYPDLPFAGTERFGRIYENSLTWNFDIHYNTEQKNFTRSVYSLLSSDELFKVEKIRSGVKITFEDMTYFIACSENFALGLYKNEYDMKDELKANKISRCKQGHILVFKHDFNIEWKKGIFFTFGLSSVSMHFAKKALNARNMERKISVEWNRWFTQLPDLCLPLRGAFAEKLRKAYYKSWVTIKNNYYDHPKWGHSVTEALPVYKGIWQWAIPSVEWHSEQNSENTSLWIKKAMDMMIDSQREDGYITHAIYIDENIPGERWGKSSTIQCPHFPWTAVRYYHATLDKESIERWYEPLVTYYKYICKSRDESILNNHLWCIFTSYDTGLDTTSAFQRVTYGEGGDRSKKERYCYPAIFAAERYRYELALAELSEILGKDGSAYRKEAELTKAAADKILWDESKKWYGVLHEDGTLDTRVGVDGLFVLAYKMVDDKKAQEMKASFERLIGDYGIRTVAAGEEGFCADVYWRGPCWPKTCSLGMNIIDNYYPDLKDKAMNSILNMILGYPTVWECYNVDDGKIAHGDVGLYATPNVSSNVGAGDIIGSIYAYKGFGMYDMDMAVPLTDIKNFHIAGLRVSVSDNRNGKYTVTCKAEERSESDVTFAGKNGRFTLHLKEGEAVEV